MVRFGTVYTEALAIFDASSLSFASFSSFSLCSLISLSMIVSPFLGGNTGAFDVVDVDAGTGVVSAEFKVFDFVANSPVVREVDVVLEAVIFVVEDDVVVEVVEGVDVLVPDENVVDLALSLAACNSSSFSLCSLISRSMIDSFLLAGAAEEVLFEAGFQVFAAIAVFVCFVVVVADVEVETEVFGDTVVGVSFLGGSSGAAAEAGAGDDTEVFGETVVDSVVVMLAELTLPFLAGSAGGGEEAVGGGEAEETDDL